MNHTTSKIRAPHSECLYANFKFADKRVSSSVECQSYHSPTVQLQPQPNSMSTLSIPKVLLIINPVTD